MEKVYDGDRANVVTFTGGTGGATLHLGLGSASLNASITAVTGAGDDGGAQSLFVKGIGLLPTSDLLQIVVAVLPEPYRQLFKAIFGYRFVLEDFEKMLSEDTSVDPTIAKSAAMLLSALAGNRVKLGNLIMMALTAHYGSEAAAIDAMNSILPTKVVPVTVEKAGPIVATYDLGNGKTREIVGESSIDVPTEDFQTKCPIVGLRYANKALANPVVIEDLLKADVQIFGPGDPITSVLQACILKDVLTSISKSKAKVRILVMNLMTKNGQTVVNGKQFSATDHLAMYARYLGWGLINTVLIHRNGSVPDEVLKGYESENALPVVDDFIPSDEMNIYIDGVKYGVRVCSVTDPITKCVYPVRVIHTNLMSPILPVKEKGDLIQRSLIRHDSDLLGVTIKHIVMGRL